MEPWNGVNDMKEIFKKKTEESGAGSAPLGGTTWYGVDKLLFVRIGIAAVLLCLGLFLQLGDGITLLLLLLSTLISGFDVLYQACVRLVREHRLGEELLVSIAAILAFTINEGYEAAAVMLILSTLAQGGEVITSRGELVEIGGSFRVPDIMELCGCHLREVGTTNKTHLSDYERAIGEQTRALLKVHTSNYRIVGFTESLPLSDIVALGCRTGLPVVEDLGSGSLVDLEHYGIHDEPTVQNSIRAGVDVVSFSGDKLLGWPQAGIILGNKPYIDRMKRHPLARAIRVDKMTIAALWATLTTYQDLHRAEQEIPTLAMLAVSGEDLRASAAQLCALLKERGVAAEVVAQSGPVGGGSVPTQLLPTFAVALPADKLSPNQAEQALRCREKPIIGRITEGRLLLDVRTIFPEDMEYIADTAAEVLA